MTKQSKVNCIISAILVIALVVCVILDHCTIGVIATIIGAILILGGTCIVTSQNKKLSTLEKPEA